MRADTGTDDDLQYFLALDGVTGQSDDRTHRDEIEVDSFTWGVTGAAPAGHGAGAGTGRSRPDPVTLVAPSSAASPLLFRSATTNVSYRRAVLTVRRRGGRDGGRTIARYELRDVRVTAFRQRGDGAVLEDEFSLSYRWVTHAQLVQNPDGSLRLLSEAVWDVSGGL